MPEAPPAAEVRCPATFMALDRAAVVFLIVATAAAILLTALAVHGSSIGMLARFAAPEAYAPPLLGHAQEIRMDEWNHFTPALLYQLRRPDRLAFADSVFGPHNAALLANLPSRHWSTVFRPQFWAFFVLPDRYAFAAWWQFKNWLLLAGLFLLFRVFVRSSGLAIFGALWFFFSSFTQWWFSSPTAMPEMVGLLGFVVAGACYLMVGRNPLRLALAGVGTAACLVNFVLCLYPSFLIPLALVGFMLIGAFALARRAEITEARFALRRLAAIALCFFISVPALFFFFAAVREPLGILRHTIYPGMRIIGGGEVSVAELASHALNPWETPGTLFPSSLVNVCEASGFFWFTPIAIVLALIGKKVRRTALSLPADSLKAALRTGDDCARGVGRITFIAGSLLFCALLAWMLLPHSARLDASLLLNHVSSHRAIIALGLLNICLTLLYLDFSASPGDLRGANTLRRLAVVFAVSFTITSLLLFVADARLRPEASPPANFLPVFSVLGAAVLFSALATLLITGHACFFAALTILSLIIAHGLINPLERGLGALDRSALHQFAGNVDLHRGRWLVFSPGLAAAPFFSANGLDVFNSARFIPDLEAMHLLDPGRRYETLYNQSGYLLATPELGGAAPVFRHPSFFVNECSIDPLDPRLRALGIRFEAFDTHLDPRLIPASLRRLVDHPVDGFWLYEIPPQRNP